VFVIAVAAAEAAVGLGLLMALQRSRPAVHIDELTRLKW
jgi:NADH-quinone oxidoreductase subunit K